MVIIQALGFFFISPIVMQRKTLPRWTRKLHRWGTAIIIVPFLIILATGILLQWKKDVAWIQPESQQGVSSVPSISFERLLEAVQSAPEAQIATWADIERVDVRPDKGIAKVRSQTGWEVQVDTQTGDVLQVAFRRSDIIEALHDGSWFHDGARLWLFFPVGVIVLGMYLTGLYLFYIPYRTRWRRRKRKNYAKPPAAQTKPASLNKS